MKDFYKDFIKDYVKNRKRHVKLEESKLQAAIQDYYLQIYQKPRLPKPSKALPQIEQKEIERKFKIENNAYNSKLTMTITEACMLIISSDSVVKIVEDGPDKKSRNFYYIPDDMIKRMTPSWWLRNKGWALPALVSFFISIIGGLLQTYLNDRVVVRGPVEVKLINSSETEDPTLRQR